MGKADLICYNAKVITLDQNNPLAEMVAIRGDKILAATKKSDLSLLTGPHTRLIDCQGMTVIPGFNDAHCHPIGHAITLLHIDCSPLFTKNIEDIKKRIRTRAQEAPRGTWLKAAQYNELLLVEKRHPTRWELDEAAPEHPVILIHYTGGTCVLNSMALRLVGISRDRLCSTGDLIGRDKGTGEPDGIIFGLGTNLHNSIPREGEEELRKGIGLAAQKYLSYGITSLQDTGWSNSLMHWNTYRRFKDLGDLLPQRISMMIGTDYLEQFTECGLVTGSGDAQLRIGGVKIALDERMGIPHPPQSDINHHALKAHLAGYQLAFHVHDQYNLRSSLEAMDLVLGKSPRSFHRHRMEHCLVCTPDLLGQVKQIRPVIVTQPSFLHYDGQNFLETVPFENLHSLLPIGSLQRMGVPVALSSDSPMMPCDPLMGIYTAVTRRELRGRVLALEERISPYVAFSMYSLGGAYASFEEDIKGTITPGKYADMVILSKDLAQVEPEEIKDISVMVTIVNGKVVFER